MSVTVLGNYPALTRCHTGFWSLDRALRNQRGDYGIPNRCMIEVYGAPGVGKSTWVYTVASKINPAKGIALADLEGLDPKYVTNVLEFANFNGSLEFIIEDSDEKTLDKLISVLSREDMCAGILDSVGAISPIAEREGDMGEAVMGRRAKLMAVLARKAIFTLRIKEEPSSMFLINHVQQLIGGMGSTTSGGDTKKYMAAIRIRLSATERFDDGSHLVTGKIEKNRFGIGQQQFTMFYLGGKGFHQGLSAMFDCVTLGIAKRDRTIKIGDDSYGFISKTFEKANEGDEAFFLPFQEALKTYEKE
jgi:RecA/RadA recombinase